MLGVFDQLFREGARHMGRTGAVGGEPEPSDGLRAFGAALKAFREHAGMSREQLASQTNYSLETIRSVEIGRRFPQPPLIAGAEKELNALGVLTAMATTLEKKKGLAAWFRDWADLEALAVSLYTYECRVVPGLLQTEAYMRAVIANVPPTPSDEEIEHQVRSRLARQGLLTRLPLISLNFIIEQAVLLRETGGTEVTRGQIDHLLECAKLRNVDLQLMPLRTQPNHAGHDGSVRLLEGPDHRWLGYFDGPRGGGVVSDAAEVSIMARRYATMRSQALTPEDTVSLLQRMRGDL